MVQPSDRRLVTEAMLDAELGTLTSIIHPPVFSIPPVGWWFGAQELTAVGAATVPASGSITATRLVLPRPVTVDQFAVQVTTAAAGRNLKALIYDADAFGMPQNLVQAIGPFSLAATGTVTVTTTIAFPSGIYWIVYIQDATSTAQVRTCHQRGDTQMHALTANEMSQSADTAVKFACGTYASPASTATSIAADFSITTPTRPHLAMHRA